LKNKKFKILVSLDGSKNALRGLKFAVNIAKQSSATIIGLNVISSPIFLKKSSKIKNESIRKSNQIIKQAKMTTQDAGVSFTGTSKVSTNIGKTIVAFAEKNKADMIIIGSRGPNPEIEMFLGSVANYVVNKSKIPVTIVK